MIHVAYMVMGNRAVPTGRPDEVKMVAAMVVAHFDRDKMIQPQLREFADREGFSYGEGQALVAVECAATL